MIWKVHGKTFSKICQERYTYVSNVAQRRFLAKAGQQNRADNLPVRYIAGYSDIPDKELRAYPLFPVGTKGKDVDYDRIVCDTYDFLDKLIGFKLSDLFYAIFISTILHIKTIGLKGWQNISSMEQRIQPRYGCFDMDFRLKKLSG